MNIKEGSKVVTECGTGFVTLVEDEGSFFSNPEWFVVLDSAVDDGTNERPLNSFKFVKVIDD